jgi:flagellar biosynthesis/type III secretory pathway chaperone
LNSLLIDIIHRIQEQNKKNQMFLNKAMLSLREIKQGFTGKKTYTTYGADGMTRAVGR